MTGKNERSTYKCFPISTTAAKPSSSIYIARLLTTSPGDSEEASVPTQLRRVRGKVMRKEFRT